MRANIENIYISIDKKDILCVFYLCMFAVFKTNKNKMTNLKERLKNGETIIFDNELFCSDNNIDDFRQANCRYMEYEANSWANGFKISFNGADYSFKTFSAFNNKLSQLTNDFNLTFNEIETNEIN